MRSMTEPLDTEPIRGRTVLVPRGGAWGERVSRLVAERGGVPVVAPLIETKPPRDLAARDRAFADLAAGAYDWVFITSATSVEHLRALGIEIPAATRVAAVGRATARAVVDAGFEVDFVPAGRSSALSLTQQWCTSHDPASAGRCLVLRSDLAMAVVSDELEVRGFDVEVCIAYRTVGVDLPEGIVDDLRSGRIDTVLLTSTSVVRELAHQVGALPEHTLVASLGPGTTRDAERRGLRVSVTSPEQSIESLIAELSSFSPSCPSSR